MNNNMVGIIPKPIKKASKWPEFIPYAVLGLVFVVVLVYAALFYLQSQATKKLDNLEDRIGRVGTQDERFLETQLIFDKQRIDDFSVLFAKHKTTSGFYKFLEENCHPEVWFTELILDSEDSQVVLTGETPNFQTFGQQIALFQNQELVKNIEISDLSVDKRGLANFTFSLTLDPKIFQNE